MNEIFVPYEVRLKLEEIGFDTPCIAYYGAEINTTYPFNFQYKPVLISINLPSESAIPAPTWEQVFEWFRDKGYYGYIDHTNNCKTCHYEYCIINSNDIEYDDENCFHQAKSIWSRKEYNTYEEAREELVLKIIEISKNRNTSNPKVVQNINNNGAIIGNSINIGNINGNIKL